MPPPADTLAFFRLKPIRAARVSEISETTAAAPIPDEDRVNFHIGNPLEDDRLTSLFLRIALGIDPDQPALEQDDPQALRAYLGWEEADEPKIALLSRMIRKSIPYMPRGGYNRKAPHALIKALSAWLQNQQEPLRYDTGESSGQREMILASGGLNEALRVLFFALSAYLEIVPARLLSYRLALPTHLRAFSNLTFEELSPDESAARQQVEQFLANQPATPTFLLIGGLLGEDSRRRLRRLSLERPLFFIEVNNAPNHLSLAREAKLAGRVIRFLTPAIFAPSLHALSTVFILGNADFLNVMENVHFSLKGTPSAAEVELLIYLLEQGWHDQREETPAAHDASLTFEGLATATQAETALPRLAAHIESQLEHGLERHNRFLRDVLERLEGKAALPDAIFQRLWQGRIFDEFSAIPPNELIDLLVKNSNQPAWSQALQRSFISAFTRHQPHYRPAACLVTSGSSRTALGILGFHCGIEEVVIPDLSWSYEQCFPRVHAVPLTPALELDVDAILARVKTLCQQDEGWRKRGAVVVNNPHNATGRVFSEAALRRLIAACLQDGLWVIDDLAYQNVVPQDELPEIKTVRQIAADLALKGILSEAQARRVITVHSLSKTDCLAGARLAIVEIQDEALRRQYEAVNAAIQPNLGAILIAYLFYRGAPGDVRRYWRLRNAIFGERTQALLQAVANLPQERNPFDLTILPPTGSMYPLLQVKKLPDGLSLDWLASSLARQGIGLLPLATFARSEDGYDTGRTTFRLTLGGSDNAEILLAKARRLLIDMNRLIAQEQARYNRKTLPTRLPPMPGAHDSQLDAAWADLARQLLERCQSSPALRQWTDLPALDGAALQRDFLERYAPERLAAFHRRLRDRALIGEALKRQALSDDGRWLAERLDRELMKDSLQRRQEAFRLRTHDRTVHPTQMYSLTAELALDDAVNRLIAGQPIPPALAAKSAQALMDEYLGRNVAVTSPQEADEILLDLTLLTESEEYALLFAGQPICPLLSFWSDWDGSSRPSGQGHRLVGALVMANVERMARLLACLRQAAPNLPLEADLLAELERLPQRNQRFTRLLNAITQLTHQLEQRYRGILSFSPETTPWQRLASRWRLRRVPARLLWEHNDRYERKMLELRQQRYRMLDEYFALNKRLRKQLHALIPEIVNHRGSEMLLREAAGYRDLLQRSVITPRVHQGMITLRDQFAIDTTAYNICEINAISGKYGNPGMTLALQVSLATKPEALISLDRKMHTQAERMRRLHPGVELPAIWLIPLFEDLEAVTNLRPYLDRVWDYATQSRQTWQTPQNRFAEIISEVFIAGSDLSQQVSQPAAAYLYRKAKYELQTWLAEHGVAEAVRIKLGSGETMQRQGGYYSRVAGQPAFINSEENRRRYARCLPAAARRSTAYAVTPLQGVFLGGDLRTFQSNISEGLRFLPREEAANLLYHVCTAQQIHRQDLIRAAETMVESRLEATSRSAQELVRLTLGTADALYEAFLQELTENFRHILYGRDEDVVGIHIISYFIGRTLPQLRDRPLSRQIFAAGDSRSAGLAANIAEMIPLSRQGSLMRAIAHQQAQTVALGVNQLTTGLFRALERFSQRSFSPAEKERMLAERILPHLPVYEILNTLRLYQDWRGDLIKRLEAEFPAGNSVFVALREDSDAMQRYLPLFQQELLRRHGVNVGDFFNEGSLTSELLPTLRPDLAVLLQKDLFNTQLEAMLAGVSGKVSDRWRQEVARYLRMPGEIQRWRAKIWEVIGESVSQRVHSFAELATALYAFSSSRSFGTAAVIARGGKISPALAGFFRVARSDDEMRAFLLSTLEYLSSLTEGTIEVPVSILRAMNDLERIAQIERSPLPAEKKDVIRCCILQIARLAGENG